MAWNPNIRKGVDAPVWDMLAPCPIASNTNGTAVAYDGYRYIYWFIVNTASGQGTPHRYDTWSDGWQSLMTPVGAGSGGALVWDRVRNIGLYTLGNGSTTYNAYNVDVANKVWASISNPPFAASNIAGVVTSPSTPQDGAGLAMADDSANGTLTANGAVALLTSAAAAGSTSTSILTGETRGSVGYGYAGLYVRFTSGTLSGQRRAITARTHNSLTTVAFALAPSAGDTFVVELPEGTATSGSTTTLVQTGAGWTTNRYGFQDVVIISGAGAGDRKRIASNTTDTLTLAAAVTGNPRTGPFATAPDATSVFRIVPSTDFVYFMSAANAVLYRLDVVQTTGAAWATAPGSVLNTPSSGGNLMWGGAQDPFAFWEVKGVSSQGSDRYSAGTGVWEIVSRTGNSMDFPAAGSSTTMIQGGKRMVHNAAGSNKLMAWNLATLEVEPMPMLPYTNTSTSGGQRMTSVVTPDGVEYLYWLRGTGQELFRVPLDWLV